MKVIVKYYGNLDGVRAISENVKITELLAQYAVVDIDARLLDKLRRVPEIIYIEEPRRVYPTGEVNISGEELPNKIYEKCCEEAVFQKENNRFIKERTAEKQSFLRMMQNEVMEGDLSGQGVLVGIVDSGDCVKYNAAAYLRLSRKDKNNVNFFSDSIDSQKKIISDYIKRRKDILLSRIYIDDGYTGQNFNRPGFKKMINDIESGEINCIIVKDLSRIGRDYIEVGRLLKFYLKKMSVCFISVADDFDSDNDSSIYKSQLYLQMKNIVNDEYSRDISLRVRAQLQIHMKKGDYMGAFAPYGYKKCQENKKMLIIDENVKGIIKEIFILRSKGASLQDIADTLNKMKVLTPLEYRIKLHDNYKTPFQNNMFNDGEKKKWYPQMVKRILSNEIYAGILTQGKNKKINYKLNKSVKTDKTQWIKCEKPELALIDFELYKKVNKVIGES